MSQSLSQIYLHIVFSMKERAPFLKDKAFRERVHAFLVGICKNKECPALIIGGVEDHVHILCRFSKNIALKDFLRDLKRDSSVWIKEENPELDDFHWQGGYGAFSISPGHVEGLHAFADQENHHRKESFQDEFRRLCRKYGVEIDERYVWD